MASCPRCHKPLPPGAAPARCPACGASLRAGSVEKVVPAEVVADEIPDVVEVVESRPPPLPAARPTATASAKRLIGPFEVRKELGRGAFGVVYQARDPALERDVAVKVLNRQAIGSNKAVERFLREARVVAQMHHNHIVPVYQLGEHEGGFYIASKFVRGRTLHDLIPEGGLEPRRAVDLSIQLLDALAFAHKEGVLHRDVKPHNAMIDDEKGQLYLMDFGLAGWVGQAEMTQEGTVMGTPAYMAPEQAKGSTRQVGPASDQYSAGVVLYEMLTGHLPFEGGPMPVLIHNVIHTSPPPAREWRPDLDPALEAICLQALAKDPLDRFADCEAFAAALRAWAGHPAAAPAPAPAPAAPPRPRPPRPSAETRGSVARRSTVNAPVSQVLPPPSPPEDDTRRNWLLIAGAAVAGLVVLCGGGGALLYALMPKSGDKGERRGLDKIREGNK